MRNLYLKTASIRPLNIRCYHKFVLPCACRTIRRETIWLAAITIMSKPAYPATSAPKPKRKLPNISSTNTAYHEKTVTALNANNSWRARRISPGSYGWRMPNETCTKRGNTTKCNPAPLTTSLVTITLLIHLTLRGRPESLKLFLCQVRIGSMLILKSQN